LQQNANGDKKSVVMKKLNATQAKNQMRVYAIMSMCECLAVLNRY